MYRRSYIVRRSCLCTFRKILVTEADYSRQQNWMLTLLWIFLNSLSVHYSFPMPWTGSINRTGRTTSQTTRFPTLAYSTLRNIVRSSEVPHYNPTTSWLILFLPLQPTFTAPLFSLCICTIWIATIHHWAYLVHPDWGMQLSVEQWTIMQGVNNVLVVEWPAHRLFHLMIPLTKFMYH